MNKLKSGHTVRHLSDSRLKKGLIVKVGTFTSNTYLVKWEGVQMRHWCFGYNLGLVGKLFMVWNGK